jgi:hypothetical protein
MNIWYIFCSFGASFPVLVSCPKKNLATLVANAGGALRGEFHLFSRPTLPFVADGVAHALYVLHFNCEGLKNEKREREREREKERERVK